MSDRVFRLPYLICCDTCGQEFFGAAGEADARIHAEETYHQVRINALVRETLNEVSGDGMPSYQSPLMVTTAERQLSRDAGMARLEAIYGGWQ